MKEYEFKLFYKNAIQYENETEIVVIRDYDYRDEFTPIINIEYIEYLERDGCKIDFVKKEEK